MGKILEPSIGHIYRPHGGASLRTASPATFPLRLVSFSTTDTVVIRISTNVIALDEMHSSAVLSLLVFFFVKSQLELVRVWRDTSRHRHRRHPSRRGLALTLNVFCSSPENREQKARASRSRAS